MGKTKKVDEVKEIKTIEENSAIPKGVILVSEFAYQKAQEKKKLLEKDITENVMGSNKDYPESGDAVIAANQLKMLKEVMVSFYCVERRKSNENVLQIGDTVVLRHRKKEIIRIVDGYSYSTNVCPSLIHLLGKSRGEKTTIGNMSDVEIVDFYPPK